MDILWALLTLPYAPVRGLTAVVKVIAREAESQQFNPANIRRELEELDRAAAAGDITEAERDRGQQEVIDRLTGGGTRRAGAARRRRPAPDQGTPGRGGARAGSSAGARASAGRRAEDDRWRDGGRRRGGER